MNGCFFYRYIMWENKREYKYVATPNGLMDLGNDYQWSIEQKEWYSEMYPLVEV